MKYIDAEKLKTRLRNSIQMLQEGEPSNEITRIVGERHIKSYKKIIDFIDSLQQEQESVAERFARIVRGNLIGIDKEVQQKFEQLYFEVTGNKMYGGYND